MISILFLTACNSEEPATPQLNTTVTLEASGVTSAPTETLEPAATETDTPIPSESAPSDTPTATTLPTEMPTVTGTEAPPDTGSSEPLPEIDSQGARMVLVPGGSFTMGDDPLALLQECETFREGCAQSLFDPAGPPHEVTIDPFYIDVYEVSNEAYLTFLTDIGSHEDSCFSEECLLLESSVINLDSESGSYILVNEAFIDHPVIGVTWFGAAAYCQWRGGRLPHEAEWEMAASWDPETGTKTRYPWGDTFDSLATNFCDTNCVAHGFADMETDDGYANTAPVGSFPAGVSPVGALDMAGNVWEWVIDWFAADFYQNSPGDNPTGPEIGESRVVRGGSWFDTGNFTASVFRTGIEPQLADDTLGFRCANDAQ